LNPKPSRFVSARPSYRWGTIESCDASYTVAGRRRAQAPLGTA
jgi:hypothetical protein